MAIGKARGNKRSSAGSCSSSVTTVVIVSVCALGVWMLTSNSTASPQKTTTRINTSHHETEPRSVKLHRKIPIDATIASQDKIVHLSINDTSDSSVDHVVKHDDGSEAGNDLDTIQETSQNDDKLEKDENPGGGEDEPEPESTSSSLDDDAESLNDSDVGKQEAEEQQEEVKEEQELELSTSVIEDNQNGLEGESEEQQTQKIQETNGNEDDQESDQMGNQLEDNYQQTETEAEAAGGEDDIRDLEDNQEQEIVDEEQEKKMENQQQQDHDEEEEEEEEEESSQQHDDDGPIESHSIAAETKAQVESREEQDFRKKMEQAKIESTIVNTSISHKKLPPMAAAGNSTTIEKHNSSGIPKAEPENHHGDGGKVAVNIDMYGHMWELCNVKAGTYYIPCLDNEIAIRNLHHWHHDEHQERHCPKEAPMCLVPLPKGYKTPIPWPQSRDKIWLHNVPHKALSYANGSQNSVTVTRELVTFPRGGTQFIHGALHYIDFLQEAVPEISWGKHTRVILDVGCGVASFGGYLFDRDVLAMSFAPKDDHEAQIQFALERGIPAISAVMGTQRLPFASGVFDLIHCVHCRVPWHKEGGILLLELNRLLRPGGYFVWSAPPVYRTLEEDVQIWKEMSALTVAMCWELVTIKKDKPNVIGVAVYRKPDSNECYNERKKQQPPMCRSNDDPNAAWYMPLQACMHEVPMDMERGSHWPEEWPDRVQKPPYWLNKSQKGIYGKPAPDDFKADYEHWKRVVSKSYMNDLGINWSNIRNVMDMRAVYGGFAAALKDLKLWVLNVVNIDSPDTLPIIFERGLFGIYHDWCESFSTYPRTYDLLHADHLFSKLKNRCKIAGIMVEIDRISRPGGYLIAWDESSVIREIENLLKSMKWEVNTTLSNNEEGIISAHKSTWRPTKYATP